MKRSKSLILAFALLLPAFATAQPVPVAADNTLIKKDTQKNVGRKNPCMADRDKFCKNVKDGGDDKACLKNHQAELSRACKDKLAESKEQRRTRNKRKGELKKDYTASSKNKAAPEWVLKGGGAFKNSGTHAFYGVGSAPPTISDEYLRRDTADNRARTDIQNGFSTSTKSTRTTTHTAEGDERVERIRTTFKSGEISMAQIIEHYQAADGTIYSLAKIEMDQQGGGQP